jgi:hypothetical protein
LKQLNSPILLFDFFSKNKILDTLINATEEELENVFWNRETKSSKYSNDKKAASLFKSTSLWNLNRLNCETLEEVIKYNSGKPSYIYEGINSSYLYYGTPFSTFALHDENEALGSISYNHYGATKIWYIIDARDHNTFLIYLSNHLPIQITKCPAWTLHKILFLNEEFLNKSNCRWTKIVSFLIKYNFIFYI